VQPREHIGFLRNVAEPAPDDGVGRVAADWRAVEAYLTAPRRQQARDGLEERGLAGPVGADDRDDLAGRHAEGDSAQDLVIAVPCTEGVDLEQGTHAGIPRYASSTRGSRRTSAKGPSTSSRPSASTITGSHSSVIRSMSCSIRRNVIP